MGEALVTDTALDAQGLTLSWDGQSLVTRDISLAVRAGQIVCLVGKSGCGKTTILHALAGLTAPLEGRVFLHGEDVTGVPGRVSYMLQKDLLLPHLTVQDNVCLPLVIAGEDKASAREKAAPLFARFGLEGSERRWPTQLSGGRRYRTGAQGCALLGCLQALSAPLPAHSRLQRGDLQEAQPPAVCPGSGEPDCAHQTR